MNLSRPFIERPIATSLLALALILSGGLAYILLPVAPLPQIDFPVIQVSAQLPGASPESMAANVATPLERAFGSIAGVSLMNSRSNQGNTNITLQFDLDKDINEAAREVQAAINASRHLLPSGMPGNPQYRKVNPAMAPLMVLALSSDSMAEHQLYDFAATVIAQKLAQIKGVGSVELGGSSLPAVRVELEPRMLNQYGISLEQIRTAIRQTSALQPLGLLESSDHRWQIHANDQLMRADDYRKLIISKPDQPTLRLGDVARVFDSVENRYASGFHNDRPAVLMIVNRQPDANIIETIDAIYEQLPQLRALLPAAAQMEVTLDRSPGIRATLREAQRTLLLAVGLVVVVVLFFLRNWRAAMIPTLAVPVSLVSAFSVMYLAGFSLNNLSLMALIVATGLVVDDAIVVMENINRHIELGKKPVRAALDGTHEISFTLLSMNLSLVVVFAAILFMGGFIERLFREFSWTLIAAVAFSLLISLSLTPALCAHLLRGTRQSHAQPAAGSQQKAATGFFQRLSARYMVSLDWALRHRRLTLLVLIATVGLNIWLYIAVPKIMLPQQDTGQLMGFVRGEDSMSFTAMAPKIEAFRRVVLADPAVQDVAGFTGGTGGVNNAFMLIRLKPLAERGGLSSEAVVERLRQALPQIPGGRFFMAVDQDIRLDARGRRGTDYSYLLLASELSELRAWVPRVTRALESLPELVDVEGEVDDGAQQVSLHIDRERARQLGVNVETVASVLNNSFSQRQIATIYDALNQYRVVMQLAPEYTSSPSALEHIHVITESGARVPLSAFASWDFSIAPDAVRHEGQF
ncbi:MAG: efflux RND transporter permease subunit, partial [Spongiibacteraceae bacterium]|nr:efflux RND transporter permease subunit [Spongiibacteraceae bacterium]